MTSQPLTERGVRRLVRLAYRQGGSHPLTGTCCLTLRRTWRVDSWCCSYPTTDSCMLRGPRTGVNLKVDQRGGERGIPELPPERRALLCPTGVSAKPAEQCSALRARGIYLGWQCRGRVAANGVSGSLLFGHRRWRGDNGLLGQAIIAVLRAPHFDSQQLGGEGHQAVRQALGRVEEEQGWLSCD
jgi:hypothetical protein